jgi:CBS domain-containing protein
MGAAMGTVFGPLLPGGNPALWPLVFMAATLGGMMRAPIMATMFAFELTFDVNALLPLITASAVSYGFTVLFMRRSILTEKIARRGYHIYREYGIDPLERHFVDEVMTSQVKTIDSDTPIEEALIRHFGPEQAHRAFPVLRGGALVGMIDREALLAGRHNPAYGKIGDLFGVNVPIMALPGETCRMVASRLAVHGLERLPVVIDAQARELVGIISRSDLVKPSLAFFDEEERREKFRRTSLRGFRRQ